MTAFWSPCASLPLYKDRHIPSRHLIELRVFNQHHYWGSSWPPFSVWIASLIICSFQIPPVWGDLLHSTIISLSWWLQLRFYRGSFPARCCFASSHFHEHVRGLNRLIGPRQVATMCDADSQRPGIYAASRPRVPVLNREGRTLFLIWDGTVRFCGIRRTIHKNGSQNVVLCETNNNIWNPWKKSYNMNFLILSFREM